jgi:hypothetical protein
MLSQVEEFAPPNRSAVTATITKPRSKKTYLTECSLCRKMQQTRYATQ